MNFVFRSGKRILTTKAHKGLHEGSQRILIQE